VAWSSNPFEFCCGLEFQPIRILLWLGVPTHSNFAVAWSSNPLEPICSLKDHYIPESESEGSSQSQLWQSPAKIFRNGQLQFHKTYKGPVPLTYVNTAGVSRREQRLLRGLHPSRFGLGAPP
jgi:hypothetical protein